MVASLGACPNQTALIDHVDLVEVNHLYDLQGRLVFNQVIFYDWCPVQCRHQVRAWRLLKTDQQLPRMNWRSGRYETRWRDVNDYRHITAGERRETWTIYDPEILERNLFPLHFRRELCQSLR